MPFQSLLYPVSLGSTTDRYNHQVYEKKGAGCTPKLCTHRRTRILYRLRHDYSPSAELLTCELSGISMLTMSSNSDYLFTALMNHGITSDLIRHFSRCERIGRGYEHPSIRSSVLFVLNNHKEKSNQGTCLSYLSSRKVQQYRLNGGMASYYWISQNDPHFFSGLYKGVVSGLCKVGRLSICIDHTEDLMEPLAQDIKCGSVHAYNSHLRGCGTLDSQPFKKRVGSQSEYYQRIKSSPDFRLNTLYCGEERHTSCMVVFYYIGTHNKVVRDRCSNDLSQMSFAQHSCARTRIEIRLSAYRDSRYSSILDALLYSVSLGRESSAGQLIRHSLFTCLLFSHVSFARAKRRKSNSPCINPFNWSDWYLSLFKVCLSGCYRGAWRSLLKLNPEEFISLLPEIKKNPKRVFEIYHSSFQREALQPFF